MDGCGYCVKAKQQFAQEIASGFMVVKPSSQAPQGVSGFPHFTYGDKTASGFMSKEDLYEKLGVQSNEGYNSCGSGRGGYSRNFSNDYSGIF